MLLLVMVSMGRGGGTGLDLVGLTCACVLGGEDEYGFSEAICLFI